MEKLVSLASNATGLPEFTITLCTCLGIVYVACFILNSPKVRFK